MEGKKFRSLLRFYKNNNVEVELQVLLKEGLCVRGKIVKMSRIFRGHLVLQSINKAPMKIFLNDIVSGSIVPVDFLEEPSKNKKNKINRSSIPPKLRFEVLRRDKYVCQYCGACGKNTELEVDHVIPVSRGGTDDKDNLKTSCIECNRGKGGSLNG